MVDTLRAPSELKVRYPYMFAKAGPYAFEFPKAWFPAFAALCEQIDTLLGENKRGFRWLQTKEKFGTARYYWKMTGQRPRPYIDVIGPKAIVTLANQPKSARPTLASRIGALVRQAEEATRGICFVCGQSGELAKDRSWLLVLCPEHREQDRLGTLKFDGFQEDEL